MKKTLLAFLACLFAAVFVLPLTVSADMGPKPSVTVTVEGADGRDFYGTLLSERRSTGPQSAYDPERHGPSYQYSEEYGDEEVFRQFIEYEDPDGYYFLQICWPCEGTDTFAWTYYPPQRFKVLLYFPDTGEFVSSGILERYAFDSYFTASLTGEGLAVRSSYEYRWEIFSLLARILLTIAAELLVALLFRFRGKRTYRTLIWVNVVTQVLLNVGLNLINYYGGQLAFTVFYVLLELVVFAVEGGVLALTLGEKQKVRKLWLYALAANACSFALGLALAHWIPGIF